MRRIAVIPAFEPDERMIPLLREAVEAGLHPVVVDDGSGPDYELLFQTARQYAQVLTSPVNRGKGDALKRAFRWILEREEDAVAVVLDCDGQHRVADALRLCAAAERNRDTLFLGCRRQSAASPLRSRIGNGVTRLVYRASTGKAVYDTQTGLRACHIRLLPRLLLVPGERYEYEMNVLLHFARGGIPMEEIPIETIYYDNNAGSHFRTLRDSWRIYREIIAFSASSLLGFAIDYLLYSLLILLTGGTMAIAANVAARLVSASVNFSVNRALVFRDREPLLPSAAKYALLAAGILAANSILLSILLGWAGLNPYLAKLLTEVTLFVCSWLVQRKLIFKKREQRRNIHHETILEQ